MSYSLRCVGFGQSFSEDTSEEQLQETSTKSFLTSEKSLFSEEHVVPFFHYVDFKKRMKEEEEEEMVQLLQCFFWNMQLDP